MTLKLCNDAFAILEDWMQDKSMLPVFYWKDRAVLERRFEKYLGKRYPALATSMELTGNPHLLLAVWIDYCDLARSWAVCNGDLRLAPPPGWRPGGWRKLGSKD